MTAPPLPPDDPRAAILRRRARFVAAAMAALAAEQCGPPGRDAVHAPAPTTASSASPSASASASKSAPAPSASASASPPDADGDGIADPDDACPTVVGVASPTPSRHGCPAAVVRVCLSIVVIERPQFDPGSAKVRPEAKAILDAAADVMKSRPELQVEVSGHCDASEQPCPDAARAEAVRDELARRGVDRGRLRTRAAGRSQPIDGGASPAAQARNRRAELEAVRKP